MSNDDYLQPDFYRFNEDSLKLVNFVSSQIKKTGRVIDIGSGCGVIGIELAQKITLDEIHFLELQPIFKDYLEMNIDLFIPKSKSEVIISSLGVFKSDLKYDLIVSNPPYYLPGAGQLGPNPHRNLCRSFLEEGWVELLQFIADHLAPLGISVVVIKNDRQILKHVEAFAKQFPLKMQKTDDGEICFLQFSFAD